MNNNIEFPTEQELKEFIKNYVHGDKYPEDDWVGLGESFDINLWTTSEATFFTVYPVVDGRTQTENGKSYTFSICGKPV